MDKQLKENLKPDSRSEVKTLRQEKPKGLHEVKEKTGKVLRSESAEAAESSEGVERGDGRVSETASEDKAFAPATGGQAAYTADEIEAIRAKLLAALPSQEIMVRQIKSRLIAEEKVLTKRMKKLQKKAHLHAFQLTEVVAQLRRLREYFSMLAHATFELVKHLWLKIVHGV